MDTYSVPQETHQVFLDGIINNTLHASAPPEIKEAAKGVEYVGGNTPTIPINWRFAESISALKGFEGSMLNVLLKKKYGVDYQKIVINTDHAQLFIMSAILPVIDPLGESVRFADGAAWYKYFPNGDIHNSLGAGNFTSAGSLSLSPSRLVYSNGFEFTGSMNASIVQEALGLDLKTEISTWADACKMYQDKILEYTAAEIETMMNDQHRQAGTTCWSTEEYKASEHGKANAHVGLFEVHHIPNPQQAPVWWTPVAQHTTAARPLFGLKVLDLTRVIASPAITRELAELGASVLRITSPNVTDITNLLPDLGWGKWNAHLDLTKTKDRDRLRTLIEESDVVVDGYRPGVMQKWGFGKDDILGMFKERERGIIYVHENCYGWNGPWSYRSGWQQISDAVELWGITRIRTSDGHDEAVTPVLPNSDFCTGVAGATGVLQALIERSEKGGSYVVDVALNYYSQWLVNSCSTYPPEIWDTLWAAYGRRVFRHTDNMSVTLPLFLRMLMEKGTPIFNPSFFENRENKALGVPIRTVKPVLGFPQGLVKLGYNVGSRGNGVDKARWPEDLQTEVL
ncbi:CoA-transferase family III domain-containing protein [Flammula alnicola]|nr:CoA-transferase family III domain-containing protein [Flammula alnicola]